MKDINLYEFTTVYWGPEATVKNPLIDQGTITFDLELNDTGEDILDCFIRLNKDGNNIENQSCDELNMNGNNKDLFFTGLEKNTSYEIAVYLLYYHEEIIESVSTYEFTTGTWLDKPTAMLENPVLNKEEISFDITFIDPDKSFIDCTIILLKGNLKVSDNYCSGHPPYENKDLNYTLGFSTLEKNTAYTIFINIDYTDGANNREYEHKLYEFTTGSWLATPKARFSSDPYIEGNTIYFTPNVTDVDNTLTKLTYAIMQGDIIIEEWIPLEHEWPYTVERFYTGIVENVLYQVVVKADFYDGEEHKSVILARYDLMKVPIDTTVSGSLDRVNPKDKYYFSIEEDQVINFTIQSELGVIAELYDVNKKQYVYIPSNYDKHNANFSVHLEAGTYSIRIMADYNYIAEYDFSIEPSASQ